MLTSADLLSRGLDFFCGAPVVFEDAVEWEAGPLRQVGREEDVDGGRRHREEVPHPLHPLPVGQPAPGVEPGRHSCKQVKGKH